MTRIMNFEEIRKEGRLLFESVRGSHLFGLNTETSDVDTFGVFIGPEEWFLGNGKDKELYVKSEKSDDYWDELDKYFFELGKSNPEALVSLFTPEKFILHYDPVLDPLFKIRDSLITKKCFKSFASYAYSQIKKAKGYNKAVNIDKEQVKERKTPLDFCQVPVGIGTWTLRKWLRDNGLKQEYCGISRLPGTVECFALFYDWAADEGVGIEKYWSLTGGSKEKPKDIIGYRGLLSTSDPLSSQLRTSSIPFTDRDNPLCYFQFNSGAYSQHCMDYKRYWDWVKHRNPERYKLNKDHSWDGKNMSHCVRIMTMALEIAKGEGMKLDRTGIDKDWLLKIKNHGITYDELIKYVEDLREKMEEEFEKSKLPEEPDLDVLNDILIKIRKDFYHNTRSYEIRNLQNNSQTY